jgi:ABC-2 type transport system ATP-binding protein
VCYSTHYLPEVEALGASVAILDGGHLVARGTLAELVAGHGRCVVELAFDGPAPDLGEGLAGAETDGAVLRLPATDPAADAARALGALGPEATRLRSVELVRPSLESVFLAVTGRRYEEDTGVPAA